jgi:hypothetical protein
MAVFVTILTAVLQAIKIVIYFNSFKEYNNDDKN